jgi:hypothetical protein
MYDPPSYVWVITLTGVIGIPAATCAVLYGGAIRAELGRRRAALLTGGAAVVVGGWFAASAVIADHGWYGGKTPWLPVAFAGFTTLLLALRRLPMVSRALAAPGTMTRLPLPHTFRVAGLGMLLTMALGHLPALFALPAGLGDIATGLAAPLVALRLAQGTGRRRALWFNGLGTLDLFVAVVLGALTSFQIVDVTPVNTAITELPLALIPTAAVPLLLVLHITALSALTKSARAPLPASAPLTATTA